MVQNTPDLILVLDAEGKELYASPSVQELTGAYSPEEHRGKSLFDFVHPEDAELTYSIMAELLANPGGTSPKTEFRALLKDGSWRHYESTGTNLLHEPSVAGIVINARDITERKRAEKERRDYEERLRVLADAALEGILISDGEVALEVNQALADILGYEPEEMVGENGLNFIAPEYRETVARNIAAGSEEPYEVVGLRKDGSRRDLEVRGRAFFYRGQPVRVTAVRDVTERKRNEEALRESEKRFQSIFDRAPLGISIADSQRKLLETNPAYQRLTGYTAEELQGKPIAELSHPDDVLKDEAYNEEVASGDLDSYRRGEKRYVRKDGEVVWVEPHVSAVRDSGGEVRFLIGMVEDVTERRQIETKLRESGDRHRLLVQNISDLIALVDIEGVSRYLSPSLKNILGRAPEEMLGKSVFEQIHPEDLGEARAAMESMVANPGEKMPPLEIRARHKDGSWRSLEVVTTNRLEDPAIKGLVFNIRDVSDRKRIEEGLRESNRHLEELATMKADFTAMVAHELGSPLAAVRGLVEMLEAGGSLNEEQRRLLSAIDSETEKLFYLVSDSQEATAIERDDFGVISSRVAVDSLLEDVATFASATSRDHSLEVENTASGEVRADPIRIGQVLRNLTSNAIKYTPKEKPVILRALDRGATVRFEVVDQGPGISSEDAARMFEKFGRGRDPSGQRIPGLGLGLYISRRVVRAHGGELSLDSTLGEGSTFWFELEKVDDSIGE